MGILYIRGDVGGSGRGEHPLYWWSLGPKVHFSGSRNGVQVEAQASSASCSAQRRRSALSGTCHPLPGQVNTDLTWALGQCLSTAQPRHSLQGRTH